MRRDNRVVLIRNGKFLATPTSAGHKLCWTQREELARRFASVASAQRVFQKLQSEYNVRFYLDDWSFASLLPTPSAPHYVDKETSIADAPGALPIQLSFQVRVF